MPIKKILVVYKTHLDVGFTDYAHKIVDTYIKNYIPTSINTALELNKTNPGMYIWLAGSWILDKYLNSISGRELDDAKYAIEKGLISWHMLPFTMHSELLTPELLEYGLSISKKLDRRFGKYTRSAKITDVPGITKALIKPLYNAGVKFIHIGVNGASAMPKVPPMFRWRNDDGETITVMYNGNYGEYTPIDAETAVYFSFMGDNCKPQQPADVISVIDGLREEYPDAEITAANLNDVADAVEKVRDRLPLITSEIGDSWAHGTGSDPQKTFGYFSLLDMAKRAEAETAERIYEKLLLVPEHTWGRDEKTTLADHVHFSKQDFNAVRNGVKFRIMEKSWEEQRAYVKDAAAILGNDGRKAIAGYKRKPVLMKHPQETLPYCIKVNEYGEITALTFNNKTIADDNHRLCSFLYEQFSENEYYRFLAQYNRRLRVGQATDNWHIEDFSKIGMRKGIESYKLYKPKLVSVKANKNTVVICCDMPKEAHDLYGCPGNIETALSFTDTEITVDFAWFNKEANRMAEAMWLRFCPVGSENYNDWRIEKLGQMINPFDRVDDGGVQHHTNGAVRNGSIEISSPDGGLVSFGMPNLLNFTNQNPDPTAGLSYNLYNNVWGTNFPMWNSDDGRRRYVIKVL